MLDRTTVFGLIATLALVAWVMVAGAGLDAAVFCRWPSLILVIGGTILTTAIALPGGRLRNLRGLLANAFYVRTRPAEDTIITLMAMSELARRQGLLSLDRPVAGLQDGFLKRTLEMVIDGYEADDIRHVMQLELESVDLRHTEGRGILEMMGRAAPSFGMMGTLIGLVIMLGQMNEPTRIGPGMAVALLTTLYGLIFANVFCWPIARKLRQRNSEELLSKTVALEGALSIQAGDHPRVVVRKLQAFLPPDRRGEPVMRGASDRLMKSGRAVAHGSNGRAAAGKPKKKQSIGTNLNEAA